MGCVYTLGIQPGTEIYNNICHDVDSYNYGGWGLYLDEGSSYITHKNNIVYSTVAAGVHQHYGESNLITNIILGNVNTHNLDAAFRSSQWAGMLLSYIMLSDRQLTVHSQVVAMSTSPTARVLHSTGS